MKRLYGPLRLLTAALCAYESEAIMTERWPTLSQLSGKHRWLAPALLGALALHLYWPMTPNERNS